MATTFPVVYRDYGQQIGQYLGEWQGPPVNGKVTVKFGAVDPLHPVGHTGIDIGECWDKPVMAAAPGRVRFVETDPNADWYQTFGYSVILEHGDVVTLYAHLRDKPRVKYNQTVNLFQVLGFVGNTGYSFGSHLHFGVAPLSNPWLQREHGLIDPLALIRDPVSLPPKLTRFSAVSQIVQGNIPRPVRYDGDIAVYEMRIPQPPK